MNDNVYDAPSSDMMGEDVEVKYAGFWVRFLACLIDSIWMLPLIFMIAFAVYGEGYFSSEQTYQGPIDIFLQYVFPIFLTLGFWMYKSATPGKMLLNLKIVNVSDLQQPSKGCLILRYVGYYVSTLLFGLGFLWAAFDPKKQTWHDKMAKTLVIYDR